MLSEVRELARVRLVSERGLQGLWSSVDPSAGAMKDDRTPTLRLGDALNGDRLEFTGPYDDGGFLVSGHDSDYGSLLLVVQSGEIDRLVEWLGNRLEAGRG